MASAATEQYLNIYYVKTHSDYYWRNFCKILVYLLAPTEYQDAFYLHHAGFQILILETSL